MNTLDAYEKDIHLQPEFMRSFHQQTPISVKKQSQIIFAGSGDSLAASLLAESISGGLARAVDPMDLYQNRHLLDKKSAYFISISGDTIANIKAARIATDSTAVTANPHCRLVKSCSRSIVMSFPSSGIFTAGSISFLASALTCASLIEHLDLIRTGQIFSQAKDAVKDIHITPRIFILGNYHTYPLAMYCAAKLYEVLGIDAHYSRIEQFSHMELFSARKNDTVIVFDGSSYSGNIVQHLRSAGLTVHMPRPPSKRLISHILFFTFFSQFLALSTARKLGLDDCHFVLAKKLRNASNNIIY